MCADSLSEREDQRRQCHSQSQSHQPSQQEELLWPTVRPIPRPSLLDDEANVEPENIRRLLVLGSANVGKSAIINRFLENPFSDKYFPTVEDFHRKVGIVQLRVGDYINTIYDQDLFQSVWRNPSLNCLHRRRLAILVHKGPGGGRGCLSILF